MISRWVRTWHGQLLKPFLLLLNKIGVAPNALTAGSLILVIASGCLFAIGEMTAGALVLLFGALLDGIDGALARTVDHETPKGSFLDSICDHYGDFAVYLGLLWFYLNVGGKIEILLIFIALFGSLVGSHTRSRAAMVGIETKTVGISTRFERVAVLVSGILIRHIPLALAVLALMNNFSAFQRILYVFRQS